MASQTSLRNRVRRAVFGSQARNIGLRRSQFARADSPGQDDGDALPAELPQRDIAGNSTFGSDSEHQAVLEANEDEFIGVVNVSGGSSLPHYVTPLGTPMGPRTTDGECSITSQPYIRYLAVMLNSRLGYTRHVERVTEKASRVAMSLARPTGTGNYPIGRLSSGRRERVPDHDIV
uniref:Uncharacterized protein n=1 Tax=Bracon brevicornis TaxID=1563983 RepID=A0A6V7JI66_9HYME